MQFSNAFGRKNKMMRKRGTIVCNFAGAAAIAMLSAALLCGQASSGPQNQVPPAGQAQKDEPPPPPQALIGAWKLNIEKSDDPEEKMKGSNDVDLPSLSGNIPLGGQNSSSGGGRRSGGAGGSSGRSAGAGPLGGPISTGDNAKGREKILEILRPSALLTVGETENEFDLTDEQGRKRALFTDGRKLPKSKDNNYQQIAAVWAAGHLTFDGTGPRGEKLTWTFQLARDSRQLIETIAVDNSRIFSPIMIRYTYDPAPDTK